LLIKAFAYGERSTCSTRKRSLLWWTRTLRGLRFTFRTDGIPSRARISPDGRYAAFTVFLTGHSYSDAQLSTATLLVNVEQGSTIANLEEFQVLQDGKVIKAPDFNYWGVTFQRDSIFSTRRCHWWDQLSGARRYQGTNVNVI